MGASPFSLPAIFHSKELSSCPILPQDLKYRIAMCLLNLAGDHQFGEEGLRVDEIRNSVPPPITSPPMFPLSSTTSEDAEHHVAHYGTVVPNL